MAEADTTAISLIWNISNLLKNLSAMEAAHQELDLKIGKERTVQDTDIDNLTYIQAIVKETLKPSGPGRGPHEAMEDCAIGGYHVPRGTRVFMNLWKLHRDPDTWKDPDQFVPERFVTDKADVDLSGKQFELIPFGSGRRSCPGMALALQVLHLPGCFRDLNLRHQMVSVDISEEGLGIILPKVKPLEVRIRPRLSPPLYNC